jgi:hypothetical protein
LQSWRSAGITGTADWTTLSVGPVDAADPQARWVVIELHVGPTAGQDITGAAVFDQVWLGRLPHFTLTANRPLKLYQPGEEVEVSCHATGLEGLDTGVHFELLDCRGQLLDSCDRTLHPIDGRRPAATAWKPAVPGAGFYRLRASLRSALQTVYARELSLAVVTPAARSTAGEFGWALPRGEGPLPLSALPGWLAQAGVGWVKFPLWHRQEDYQRSTDLAALCERLAAQRIEVVGLLAQPPEELWPQFGEGASPSAAEIFSAPADAWYPSLELVMTPLSMKVRWWQLGLDDDLSFVGDPRLEEKIVALQSTLDRLGPDVRLGVGWGWMNELPRAKPSTLRFLSMTADPPLTPQELGAYLEATRPAGQKRWATIDPLGRQYSADDRVAALVHSLVAAKVGGADVTFIADPFHPEKGLLAADGSPEELFLPWRTTALTLSGARPIGSVPLPGGSPNQVFSRGSDAVMVVWNDKPCRETLYLGDQAVAMDAWGRTVGSAGPTERTLEVGPLPTFVAGINEPVIRLMMSAAFERRQLPSVFSVPHVNALSVDNAFPQGAGGRFRIVAPEGWLVRPATGDFKLAAGERLVLPVQFTFPYDADSGPQRVRVEFDLAADRPHRFAIERTIEVGLGDVLIEATTHLEPNGDLVVEQRITNQTDEPVSFKCDLFAPNRRRMRTQIWNLPRGSDVKQYLIPDGQDLLGQVLWIRGEEIRGPRVLSRRITAAP